MPKSFQVKDGEVFYILSKKQSIKQIKEKRRDIRRTIQWSKDQIRKLERQIEKTKKYLEDHEKAYTELNTPEIQDWLQKEEEKRIAWRERRRIQRKIANEKADNLLKEFIGEDAFTTLMKHGFLRFKDRKGKNYSVNKDGELFSVSESGVLKTRLCTIGQKELPKSDFIIATLVTIRELGYEGIAE